MENNEALINQKIIPVDIEREMKKSYLAYSMSVIVGRALPDVRDGLKPVHRRILYTMYENGLSPDKAYRKCADTVGSVLGRYHPHGDASVYDALVRMAQDFSLRYMLVDGHGNFGSVDGDPAAAYRYTEARMSKLSLEMLTDIDKETVDYAPNYDDRLREPQVLPSRFPNLLVNGSTGIAVGMATNIPPHNLTEVIDAIGALIENPEIELEELMEFIKGPDFPTGGIIMGRSGIRAAYATGRGKVVVRARAEIEEMANGRFRIVVTELPYMVNKARLLISIADLVKDKRVEGISDLRDESDRNGMRMVIELKRDAAPQIVLNMLYKFTQMQETFGVILLALANGEPKVMTLKEMLEHYIDFQQQVIRRRTEFDLKKAKEREHILEGLKIALDFIDEVIAILRASTSIPEGKEQLMQRFGLDDIQAAAIVAMRLGQLTGLERHKIEEELEALLLKIAEYEGVLADESKVLAIVREEIEEIKRRYGDERRTEIAAVSGEMDIEDLIPVEDCVVTMTRFGYMKRLPVDTYKLQRRGGRGISGMSTREEDVAVEMFISSTHDHVLFITTKGKMYRLKCYEIPEGSRTSKGMPVVNMLPLDADEKVAAMLRISDFEDGKYLVMVTKKGIVKRTALSAYKNVRKNGLIAIGLREGDELAGIKLTEGDSELFVATRNGMAIKTAEKAIRPLSRGSMGVRIIKLRAGDEVVAVECVNEDVTIMTITESGQGRRSLPSDYRLQGRGGFGVVNYKQTQQRGKVCGVRVVEDDDDILMIADDGIIIRIRAKDVRVMSRYASGVRVMRMVGEAKVSTFVRTEHDENEEIAEVETVAEDEPTAEEIAEAQKLEAQLEKEAAADTEEVEVEPETAEETE